MHESHHIGALTLDFSLQARDERNQAVRQALEAQERLIE